MISRYLARYLARSKKLPIRNIPTYLTIIPQKVSGGLRNYLKLIGYPVAAGAGLAGFGVLAGHSIREIKESVGMPSPKTEIELTKEKLNLMNKQLELMKEIAKMQGESRDIYFVPGGEKLGWNPYDFGIPGYKKPQPFKFGLAEITLVIALVLIGYMVIKK